MKMRKLYIIFLKVFLIIVSSHLKAISDERIKIGLIVPLSGEYSYIGNSILKSTRMALDKINDDRITVIPKDTKANPIDASIGFALVSLGITVILSSLILSKAILVDLRIELPIYEYSPDRGTIKPILILSSEIALRCEETIIRKTFKNMIYNFLIFIKCIILK